MIKIDIAIPNACENCPFCQIAYDSELFENGEPYCCIESESVKVNMEDSTKPEWCPIIEDTPGCDCCKGVKVPVDVILHEEMH